MSAAAPTEPTLLRAVVAAPRDLAPRLRYADWLDARGWIEWADFIRRPTAWFPCEPRRPVRGFTAAVRAAAGIPAHVALSLHDRVEWWECMKGQDRRRAELFTDHGFVEAVSCRAKFWARYGPALVASQPIAAVALTDPPAEVRADPLGWARKAAGLPATAPVEPATAPRPSPAVPEPAALAF